MLSEEIIEKTKRLIKKSETFEYPYEEYIAREFTRSFANSVVVGEREHTMQALFAQVETLREPVRWGVEDVILAKKARKNISIGDYETLMAPWRRLEALLDF